MPPRDLALPLHTGPVEAFTRRQLLTAIPGLVILAGGVACSDSGGGDAAPSLSPSSTASDGFPRDVDHVLGTTTIDAEPKRAVAASDFSDLDYLLALGMTPVLYGFTNAWDSGAMPWQTGASNVPNFDEASGTPDLEAIAAAHPDLIVGMQSVEQSYDQLSKTAPTVVLGWSTPWRDGLRIVGRSLGRDARAEQAINDTETQLNDIKTQLAPLDGRKVTVAFLYGDTFYIWGDEVAGAMVLREMGADYVGGPEAGLTSASLEQVNLVSDADILISVATDPAAIATQEANPLFRQLPAVREGRYDVLTPQQSRALGDSFSPLSLPWVGPQMVELLLRLADGGGKQLA